jgi:hypothetical protein
MKRILGGRRVGEQHDYRDGDSGFVALGDSVPSGRCSSAEVEGASVGSVVYGGWE